MVRKLITGIFFALFFASALSAQEGLELPKVKAGEIIVRHEGHTLSYNPQWLLPNWVAYELRSDELEGEAVRAPYFSPDPMLEEYPRAEHWHYTRSGWVRGHMVPAGDLKYNQEAMNASFYTSNVCPMNMRFNNSIWKRLEEKTRSLAYEHGRVYVITGPIIGSNLNGKVGQSEILVPDKFYKALLVPYKGSFLGVGFIMVNAEDTQGKLRDFAMSIDDLEKQIGADLFNNLDILTELKVEKLLPLKELGLY